MLETNRLVIRKIGQTDAQQFLDSVNDEDEMTPYLRALPEDVVQNAIMQDMHAALEFILTLSPAQNEGDIIRYGAWTRDGELVACANLKNWETGTPELQITVSESHRRQGYATEFLQCLLPWVFQNGDMKYIVYRLRRNNDASRRLVEQLGGVYQEPRSKLEALTIATYHIYPKEDGKGA